MNTRINGTKKMDVFARSFVKEITSVKERGGRATVVGLQGDLGSGKTTFAKSVAKALGVDGAVTSPTFVIEKIYKLPQSGIFSHLVHIDAYRLENSKELMAIGWEDIVNDPESLILIEWPENVSSILPEDMEMIRFKFIDENTRGVEY